MDDYKAIARRAKELGLMSEPKKEEPAKAGSYFLGNECYIHNNKLRIQCAGDGCKDSWFAAMPETGGAWKRGTLADLYEKAYGTCERLNWNMCSDGNFRCYDCFTEGK